MLDDPLLLDQRLDIERVRSMLATAHVGRQLHYVARTTSTMDEARRLAEAGAPHGAVAVSDEQTSGRGTKGRVWVSPPGQSIHATLIARPGIVELKRLSIISAVAAIDAILATTSLRPAIKWPNDIEVESRKLGGILIEADWRDGAPRYALIGIGLNINFDPAPWAAQIERPATSLMIELGERRQREPVLAALLNAFEQRYREAVSAELHETWRSRLDTLDQAVTVTSPGGDEFHGTAIDVDEAGALIVQADSGEERTYIAGEVTLRASSRSARSTPPGARSGATGR